MRRESHNPLSISHHHNKKTVYWREYQIYVVRAASLSRLRNPLETQLLQLTLKMCLKRKCLNVKTDSEKTETPADIITSQLR